MLCLSAYNICTTKAISANVVLLLFHYSACGCCAGVGCRYNMLRGIRHDGINDANSPIMNRSIYIMVPVDGAGAGAGACCCVCVCAPAAASLLTLALFCCCCCTL